MEYSPKLLASLTIQAFIFGGVLGLLYSLLRLSRILFGERVHSVSKMQIQLPRFAAERSKALTERKLTRGMLFLLRFLEDVLFCITAGVGIILLAYVGNNGRIRWFILLGTALGYTCYALTLGKLFSYVSELLSMVLRLIFRSTVFVLLFPIRVAARGIRRLLTVLSRRLQTRIRKRRDAKYHALQMKALLAASAEGFDCIRCVGLEVPPQPAFEKADELCKNNEDVKNKRRRRAYGRNAKSENARFKSEKAS